MSGIGGCWVSVMYFWRLNVVLGFLFEPRREHRPALGDIERAHLRCYMPRVRFKFQSCSIQLGTSVEYLDAVAVAGVA